MNQLTFELRSGKYYYHYPFPVAIIGVKVDEKVNFMSVAWHTQLSFDPPLYGILISPKRYTNELIKQTDAFSVNFLKFEDYKIAGFVGRTSGKDLDKVKTFELKYFDGKVLPVPVLENAIACYECKIVDQKHTETIYYTSAKLLEYITIKHTTTMDFQNRCCSTMVTIDTHTL